MSSRSCEAASSWSSASKARVWMSRRWGMSIPCSSFAKEICFNDSGMVHPGTGEKTTEIPADGEKDFADRRGGRTLGNCCEAKNRVHEGRSRKEVRRLPGTRAGCQMIRNGVYLKKLKSESLAPGARYRAPAHFTSTAAPCSSSLALI